METFFYMTNGVVFASGSLEGLYWSNTYDVNTVCGNTKKAFKGCNGSFTVKDYKPFIRGLVQDGEWRVTVVDDKGRQATMRVRFTRANQNSDGTWEVNWTSTCAVAWA